MNTDIEATLINANRHQTTQHTDDCRLTSGVIRKTNRHLLE